MDLFPQLDVAAAAYAVRRGCPFGETVHGEDRGLIERQREERACRMGLVMLGVQNLALIAERFAQLPVHEELVLQPHRRRLEKRHEPSGGDSEIRIENALELEERLVVKADERQISGRDAARPQTILHGVRREGGVPLLARKPLLLCRDEDRAVPEQAGGAVVVERGNPRSEEHTSELQSPSKLVC